MNYLIPANSKKGQLYFNLFKGTDLVIIVIGVISTFLTMFIFKVEGVIGIFFKISPILICALLVFPVAHYHNVRVFIKELWEYIMSQKRYDWKGWCVRSVGNETNTSSK